MNLITGIRHIRSWLLLAAIILLAIAVRWHTNFGETLMPGVNGLYYPIQVRSLLDKGHLGFPDLPFIFWLEALVSYLLFLLNIGNLPDCIILASKGVDSILPALSAIPVFLLKRVVSLYLWVCQTL